MPTPEVPGTPVASLADALREDGVMPSTSDYRVRNNVMRHEYRVLSEEEKKHMQAVKDVGYQFVRLLHLIGGTVSNFDSLPPRVSVPQGSRDLSLSQTAIEEAVMWAVKHITK